MNMLIPHTSLLNLKKGSQNDQKVGDGLDDKHTIQVPCHVYM